MVWIQPQSNVGLLWSARLIEVPPKTCLDQEGLHVPIPVTHGHNQEIYFNHSIQRTTHRQCLLTNNKSQPMAAGNPIVIWTSAVK